LRLNGALARIVAATPLAHDAPPVAAASASRPARISSMLSAEKIRSMAPRCAETAPSSFFGAEVCFPLSPLGGRGGKEDSPLPPEERVRERGEEEASPLPSGERVRERGEERKP